MKALLLYVGVVFVTCATPGAGVLFTVSNAFRGPRKAFWHAPLGNALGVFIVSVICAVGLGSIIATHPLLFYGLQIAGAFVLIYLGFRNWFASPTSLASDNSLATEEPFWRIVSEALVMQATNPMLIVFLLSLLPQFIDPTEPYVTQTVILLAIFTTICLLVHLVYGWIAATGSALLKDVRYARVFLRVSALLFWLIAGSVFVGFIR